MAGFVVTVTRPNALDPRRRDLDLVERQPVDGLDAAESAVVWRIWAEADAHARSATPPDWGPWDHAIAAALKLSGDGDSIALPDGSTITVEPVESEARS